MVEVKFYCDHRQRSQVIEWLQDADQDLQAKTIARIQELAERGHTLDRPATEYVEDGIFALRIKSNRNQFRVFYFFHDRTVTILTHSIPKKTQDIPPGEIKRAKKLRSEFLRDPENHSLRGPKL